MLKPFTDRYKHAALINCAGRGYGHTGDETTDCIRLQFATLKTLFGPTLARLTKVLHLNGSALGSFDNTAALVENGYGFYVDTPSPGSVCYVQGWNGSKGHCFAVVWDADGAPYILEATNSSGDTDDDGVPDRYDWFRVVDWPTQAAKYTEMRIVQLWDPLVPHESIR